MDIVELAEIFARLASPMSRNVSFEDEVFDLLDADACTRAIEKITSVPNRFQPNATPPYELQSSPLTPDTNYLYKTNLPRGLVHAEVESDIKQRFREFERRRAVAIRQIEERRELFKRIGSIHLRWQKQKQRVTEHFNTLEESHRLALDVKQQLDRVETFINSLPAETAPVIRDHQIPLLESHRLKFSQAMSCVNVAQERWEQASRGVMAIEGEADAYNITLE